MEIHVLSRRAVEAMQPLDEPHLIVSINCPDELAARIRTNQATLGRVDLFFWDLDHCPTGPVTDPTGRLQVLDGSEIPEGHLSQPSDAKRIIDLVEAHPEAKQVVVHCTAGISRSSGVAAALHKVLNGDDSVIFSSRRYSPNMRIYRMVLEEWYSRHPL